MKATVSMHFLVTGRVQGVSFRAFSQRRAVELGLLGKVRNLRDGRVELVAQGPLPRLEELKRSLMEGPRLAHVTALSAKEIDAQEDFEGFLIEGDGSEPWYDSSAR